MVIDGGGPRRGSRRRFPRWEASQHARVEEEVEELEAEMTVASAGSGMAGIIGDRGDRGERRRRTGTQLGLGFVGSEGEKVRGRGQGPALVFLTTRRSGGSGIEAQDGSHGGMAPVLGTVAPGKKPILR